MLTKPTLKGEMTALNKNRIVIVTGANGFVGQHLIPILLKRGYKVVALARDKKKLNLLVGLMKLNFFHLILLRK